MSLEGSMSIKKVAALVPMRHHSQRVPGKNYRPINGQPLFYHILKALQGVPGIQTVVVDTDSPLITEKIKTNFPAVHIIDRPAHLLADDIPMNEILMYDTGLVPADLYLQTHSTNPLLTSDTMAKALEKFISVYPAFDSLFSVTRIQSRLWDSLARPINHNPAILLQTQDLPPVYEENSCFYLFTRDTLSHDHTRIGNRPYLFEINKTEAWDIDDEEDFEIAELLMKKSKN
jgi:CMP-N-acetylneuraminic acid synthetase